jgi:hypothetical protein
MPFVLRSLGAPTLVMGALVACSTQSAVGTSTLDVDVVTADAVFVSQWGPSPFNAAGHPDGYEDCGPTSLVMAASWFGLEAAPGAEDAERAIRDMRARTRGAPAPVSGPTYTPMMLRGLGSLGLAAEEVAPNIAEIDDVLARGGVALVAGDPGFAWGRGLDGEHAYLHHYGGPNPALDRFGHWVIVFGYSGLGGYVLGDPLSTIGAVTVTASQIETYIVNGGAKSAAIAVEPSSG